VSTEKPSQLFFRPLRFVSVIQIKVSVPKTIKAHHRPESTSNMVVHIRYPGEDRTYPSRMISAGTEDVLLE
jgi:hypothetical protein